MNSANGTKILTNHIAAFCAAMVDVIRWCKRTGRSTPTEREQVLLLVGSIITTNPLLMVHISMINGDPNGLGNIFEGTSTHLMLANRSACALTGRGRTGVDLC